MPIAHLNGLDFAAKTEVPSLHIIDGEWPGIIIFNGRAFYCVGTKERGRIGNYQECRTITVPDIQPQ